MEIKFRSKQLDYEVEIVTPHNDPDKSFSLKVDDDTLRREISDGYGFYGHSVDINNINNLDLQSIARKLASFAVISINPAIAPNPLPKGAIS